VQPGVGGSYSGVVPGPAGTRWSDGWSGVDLSVQVEREDGDPGVGTVRSERRSGVDHG
jgi:hypothetical protein